MKIIIIGGVAGGASAAARLRRLDEHAEIIMIERGAHISFANCGLPYYIGGDIAEEADLILWDPISFGKRFNIDVRVQNELIEIDPACNIVTIKDLQADTIYYESYNKLILSTGAAPIKPDFLNAGGERVFTLRNVADTLAIKGYIDRIKPQRVLVAGAGYIGVEMAENLLKQGLEVTLVDLADHVIAPLDADMAADVHHYLRKLGVSLLLNTRITGLEKTERGLSVTLDSGIVETDFLIASIGVRPETSVAVKAGIAADGRGSILVDKQMKTGTKDIYAVGDCVVVTDFVTGNPAFLPLAGPANRQGRIAADNICGIPAEYNGTQGSAILKLFDMTVATTGINERTAKQAGLDYERIYTFAGSHAGYYPGSTPMSIKLLYERKTERILGAQIVGYDGVDKRCDLIAAAMRLNAKVTDLTKLELCYAPPFGSAKDPVNMLGFVAENIQSGKVKQFFWDDVANLPRDGSVTILDVRTRGETARGGIEGAVQIPLDSLRENLDQLDPAKPVYVYCHSGQRSYLACRILQGRGFDSYNLAGGYRMYKSVVG